MNWHPRLSRLKVTAKSRMGARMRWQQGDNDGSEGRPGFSWEPAVESEEEKTRKRKKKREMKRFWIIYLVVMGLLVIFCLIMAACERGRSGDEGKVAASVTTMAVTTESRALEQSPTTKTEPQTEDAATTEAAQEAATTPEPASPVAPEPDVLTVENCPELASMLGGSDQDFGAFESFANKYSGKKIQFDAHVEDMQRVEGMKTRFNVLICAGDYGATYTGPNFQYHDVNFSGMHVEPSSVDSLAAGMNVRVTATVASYNKYSSMIELLPVETLVR